MAIILSLAMVLAITACNSDDENVGGNRNKESDITNKPSENNNQTNTGTTDVTDEIDNTENSGLIQFGEYEWRILDEQDGKMLIISERGFGLMPYHDDGTRGSDITWEHSNIRAYLNGEFYDNFDSADQNRIIETTVINDDNPGYGTDGGNDTIDKIFLLSIDESELYFEDDRSRVLNARNHAAADWWWLRTPGVFSSTASVVDHRGSITHNVTGTGGGLYVNVNSVVRPAMWITIS
jgi:hypothetical protein